MEDLLSFITGNLRQKGITVNEFCEQIGISRQKFYRFVKDPRRFTEDNLLSIQTILNLSEDEISAMNRLIVPRQFAAGTPDVSVYTPLIADLFARRPSRELTVNMYNIEYIDDSGSTVMHSPDTIARILAGLCGNRNRPESTGAAAGPDPDTRHEYMFTIYNCTPSDTERSGMPFFASQKSLLTIARIIRLLEDALLPAGQPDIHVRHYLSESQRKKMMVQDAEDKEATKYSLRLLNCILPLLSTVEDYKINKAMIPRHYWTDHSNFCLVKHKYSQAGSPSAAAQGNNTSADWKKDVEYYILLFSDSGECCACRLGERDVSHIYRFLSIDTRDKITPNTVEEFAPENPNEAAYELVKKVRLALILPDLCFDDIPREMWMALYDMVQASNRKDHFESLFRKLIDPFDQYEFLNFEELAVAGMNTLEQRAVTAGKNGKIVICHPQALRDFARPGIITDLPSDSADYMGVADGDASLRFPAPLVRNLLELIRSNIVKRQNSPSRDPAKYDCLNYFIMDPRTAYPEIAYSIYKDYGVIPLYTRGRHKNRITTVFRNAAVGTLLYNYVTGTMVSKRENDLDSMIMSDAHAIALLDKLILETEKEE